MRRPASARRVPRASTRRAAQSRHRHRLPQPNVKASVRRNAASCAIDWRRSRKDGVISTPRAMANEPITATNSLMPLVASYVTECPNAVPETGLRAIVRPYLGLFIAICHYAHSAPNRTPAVTLLPEGVQPYYR